MCSRMRRLMRGAGSACAAACAWCSGECTWVLRSAAALFTRSGLPNSLTMLRICRQVSDSKLVSTANICRAHQHHFKPARQPSRPAIHIAGWHLSP